jgi:DNA-binding CsgD family transcriptional regulator
MFLFSYLSFMGFLLGLAMTAALILVRPKAVLNWIATVPVLGYSLFSLSFVWVTASQDTQTVWSFFAISVWGFGLLIPSGALAAELVLSRVRPLWAWIIWVPFTAYWTVSAVWGTFGRTILAGFHSSSLGNVGVHTDSAVLGVGAAVLILQKLVIWSVLWRSRNHPRLAGSRRLLTLFVPADAAALILIITVQIVTTKLGLPSVAGLAGLFNVGLLFFVVWKHSRILAAAESPPAVGAPWTDILSNKRLTAMLDRYGITAGEKGVLALLLQGHDRKTIAARRFIAEGTVKAHIHSIYAKTGAKNRVELMLLLSSEK